MELLACVYILRAGENRAISANDLVLLKLNFCLQLTSSVCIATVQFKECSIMNELRDQKLRALVHPSLEMTPLTQTFSSNKLKQIFSLLVPPARILLCKGRQENVGKPSLGIKCFLLPEQAPLNLVVKRSEAFGWVWSGESETKLRGFKGALGKASASLQGSCWNEGLLLHQVDTPQIPP